MGKKHHYALSSVWKGMRMRCHSNSRLVPRKNAPLKLVVVQPRIKSAWQLFLLNELDLKPAYVPTKEYVACCKRL